MSLLKLKNFQTPITLASNSWGLTSIGNELFIGDYTTKDILVYDLNTNTLLRTLTNDGFTNARALGTDGTNLYMANSTMKIMRINKNDGTIIETKTDVTFSMSNSMTFFIDIINDIIYHCDYDSTLYIKKYSDGSLIKSYGLGVSTVSSVTLINDNLVVGVYAATSKLYISSKISKGLTNLTFEQVNLNFTKLCGIAYYNNKTYFSTYTNNNIASLDVYYCLGNEVGDISNIQNIGDYIPCRYTALTSGLPGFFSELGTTTAPLIPAASSATPNGSFNLIYVGRDFLGRKMLVPDRNLRHSIPWDTLNTSGIINEVDVTNKLKQVNNSNLTHTIQQGSAYKGTPNKISDNIIDNTNGTINFVLSTPIITNVGFVSIDYVNPKIITKVVLKNTLYSTWSTMYVKNFKIQGSNDGGNDTNTWTDVFTGVTANSNIGGYDEFNFENLIAYRYYRIYVIDTWGYAGYISISEVEMYESESNDNFKASVRLLTGGTSATDTDNEWDKIIVNSNLGGTITTGDNNVWNWNGIYSWTSTSQLNNSHKTIRGYTLSASNYGGTSESNAICGFRPVLLVEELATLPVINSINKSILDNGLRLSMQTNISHQSNQNVKYKVSIKKPDNSIAIKRDYDTNFVAPNINTLEFNKDDFDLGVNTITLEVIDANNNLVTSTINITKTKAIKTLILDGEKVKHINNNNLELLDSSYSTITEPDLETLFLANGMGEDISLNQGFKSQVENTLKLLVFNTNLLS